MMSCADCRHWMAQQRDTAYRAGCNFHGINVTFDFSCENFESIIQPRKSVNYNDRGTDWDELLHQMDLSDDDSPMLGYYPVVYGDDLD